MQISNQPMASHHSGLMHLGPQTSEGLNLALTLNRLWTWQGSQCQMGLSEQFRNFSHLQCVCQELEPAATVPTASPEPDKWVLVWWASTPSVARKRQGQSFWCKQQHESILTRITAAAFHLYKPCAQGFWSIQTKSCEDRSQHLYMGGQAQNSIPYTMERPLSLS